MNTVKVKADENGGIIRVSYKNPEYGYIAVTQEVIEIKNDGWLRNAKRNALIHGKIEDLEKASYIKDQLISGKIIVKESLFPFNKEEPDNDLKIAGDTGIICRVDDQPIYRKTFFTPNLNISDELISHTNGEEIKEVLKAQKIMGGMKLTEAPDL